MTGPSASERPEVRVRRRAMDYLARREHGFEELLQKLATAFPDEEPTLLRTTVEQLRNENLQSDLRFAESWVRSRSQRGHGPVKILHELRQRGIETSRVEAALEEAAPDWVILCRQVLHKRFGDAGQGGVAEEQRCWRFLTQRGFSPEQIRAALKAEPDL